ncbi:MAG: long-chain fatty acid--CoA ligase [Chloroflexi bacterium]|nr:long-chain fatty acid--CoA ligase [Chloroflexota bacterium]
MSEASFKPWLKFYEPGVPETLAIPAHTLHASLSNAAKKFPNNSAIIFFDSKMTYRELDEAATRFAVALQKLGVKKGDRVMVYMPNTPQFVIAFYGILRAGAIVVPTNPQYVPRELAYQATDSGAETVIALTMNWKTIKEARGQSPYKRIILCNIKEYFPPLLKFLFTVAKEKKEGHRPDVSGEQGVFDFQTLLKTTGNLTPVEVNQNDVAVLGYTGGTTGVSKGAMLSHRNLVAQAVITLCWFTTSKPGEDVFMGALPLFHSFGMTCVMNTAVHNGAAMVLVPNPRDLPSVLKAAHKHRPTIFSGVPTMYATINNFKDVKKYDLTSIKQCCSGAAPLPEQVQLTFEATTGGKLVEGFGLTETCSPTHINPLSGTRKIGTIGVPVPNTIAKIVHPETGADLPCGEIGEIAIQSPQIMLGYWNKPDETAKVMLPGNFFLTGDLGKMDEDGFFTVVDRKKDMFIVGGFNVYPREIEEVLFKHPKVAEAAAVGIPDIQRGENIKAYIVLKPGETATADEIIAYCRENLTRYKVPREVEFRDALPKTLVGKVLRRTLRDEELAKKAKDT